MERLTDKSLTKACNDPWDYCGLDHVCKRDCHKPEPCRIPKMVHRLAEIEDVLGDTYDLGRLRELVEADRDGRCVVLPCGEGDRLSRGGLEYIADHWNITLTAFAKDAAAKAGERLGIFSVEESEQAFKERGENG